MSKKLLFWFKVLDRNNIFLILLIIAWIDKAHSAICQRLLQLYIFQCSILLSVSKIVRKTILVTFALLLYATRSSKSRYLFYSNKVHLKKSNNYFESLNLRITETNQRSVKRFYIESNGKCRFENF